MPNPSKQPGNDSAPSPMRQVAALCVRQGRKTPKVLLITSRDSGRWVVPKGWPMEGKTDLDSALQEAWEEAGVRASATCAAPLGTFTYDKGLDDGRDIPVKVSLYRVEVSALDAEFPEREERERRWVTPETAARMVDEPGLKKLLLKFTA